MSPIRIQQTYCILKPSTRKTPYLQKVHISGKKQLIMGKSMFFQPEDLKELQMKKKKINLMHYIGNYLW
jgi:hypothetical protein